MTWHVAGAARATTGKRANQEDAFEIWPSGGRTATRRGDGLLAVVADGMGGHAGGEVAGDLACRTFVRAFTERDDDIGTRLQTALEAGNQAIAERAASDSKLRGMGCTLIGAWIDSAGLRWVSVGDSLLLLFRAPEVVHLNADHSLGAFLDEQVRQGKIPEAEASANPYRNALRSAVTGKDIEILDLQSEPYPLADGDWLVLASYGINTLSGDEIGDILYANREQTPEAVAEALIAAIEVRDTPDQDNTTVLALKIARDTSAVPADEAPTRILRADPAASPSPKPQTSGIETTQRIVHAPAYQTLWRRHRGLVMAIGMVVMFAVGWLLRAVLG